MGADGIMGSAHTYVVPGAGEKAGAVPGSKAAGARGGAGGVGTAGTAAEISLNPEDLEVGMDDAQMAARYAWAWQPVALKPSTLDPKP